ncbi:MAG TPA: FHA domain-containing protein [Pirellulales bacterium]|nr:FHA domain-containing protein [Pirellulales bacterium]
MSFIRLVYYSALAGGWAALFGWLVAEVLFFQSGGAGGLPQVAAVGTIVGAAIGLGLSIVAGAANGQWIQILLRAVPGLVGGGVGGAIGSIAGQLLFDIGLPRALGWMIVGIGIGIVEGLYDRSMSKFRNGLIGGAAGGLIGGFLFDPIQQAIAHGSGMTSRAVAFVILGMMIGALVGLVQVVLKDAWLTVVDGYRAGRQLILSRPVTALGRGDHLQLAFLGPMNAELESEHVRIVRQANGSYLVEDNHSRLGTRLNSQPLTHATPLHNGDVIKFGTNFVRFNERKRQKGDEPVTPGFQGKVRAAPPPPTPKAAAAAPSPQRTATPAHAPAAQHPAPPAPPAKPGAIRPLGASAPPPRPGVIPPPPPPRKKT